MGRLNEFDRGKWRLPLLLAAVVTSLVLSADRAVAQDAPVAETPEEEAAAPAPETPEPVTLESVNTKADAAALAGHNAWMLTSSALVLFMTAPGLAMFYGGLVRKKNVLSVIMQCLFLMGLMTVDLGDLRLFAGVRRTATPYIGNGDYLFMKGVQRTWDDDDQYASSNRWRRRFPRLTHMLFQGMFFIITPALICGAFAERMKFSAMVVFSILWGTLVYCPLVPLGVGRRHPGIRQSACHHGRCARLRRRHGRAHQLRRFGVDLCTVDRQADRLRPRRHASAQPDLHGDWRRYAVGRLVWLQCR